MKSLREYNNLKGGRGMDEKKVIPYVIRMSDGTVIKMEHHEHMSAVSALAKEYASRGYPDRYVVFAESADGSSERGIYMSLILRPSIFPSQAIFVSPAAAAAAALALQEHTTENIGIGWISDLYCNLSCIGNISVEGKLNSLTSYEYMIVNFAIELNGKNFPPRLTDMVRQVFESESASIPMIIAKNVLDKFFGFYITLKSPQKMMNSYKNLFAMRGVRAKCTVGGVTKSCKILGVDGATCALIVEERGGKITNITTPKGVIIPKKLKKSK